MPAHALQDVSPQAVVASVRTPPAGGTFVGPAVATIKTFGELDAIRQEIANARAGFGRAIG